MHIKRSCCVGLAGWFVLGICASGLAQENWTRFRGPDATGVVPDDPRLPDTWDKETNVLWKAKIRGWGWGSPIVWGDKVLFRPSTVMTITKNQRGDFIWAAVAVHRRTPSTTGWFTA